MSASPTPDATTPGRVELPEAVVRQSYQHFMHGAEFRCSPSAMREAILLAVRHHATDLSALTPSPSAGMEEIERLANAYGSQLMVAMGCGLKNNAVWQSAEPQLAAILSAFSDILTRAETAEATLASLRAEREGIGFQARNRDWAFKVFTGDPTDLEERRSRFGEEALELQQALGQTADEAHQLVDYVHGRPIGEPAQEMGGVMTTLALLAWASALDMMACGEAELQRVNRPEMISKIRAKRATRAGRGALPGIDPDFTPRTLITESRNG